MLEGGWSRSKPKETKYMLMSLHHNAGLNCNIQIANKSFENVAKFMCLGMAVTNEKLIHDKSRLNLGNALYCSVQNFLSSCLLEM
jgi:hypothetical protein